ncbi:Rieske (2Fe-2S) protein [Mycobacterium sp. ELW1]|uniref:aromatic ring-hydroxylating oxygenase subunit alpha n=1 Tax=Mycobacterium sp. ELW1 TaxID=1547487 RepID=UPI00257064AF|nr:Rieske (2Fe-2S) protein [Mycobacterium sp. ELW1]
MGEAEHLRRLALRGPCGDLDGVGAQKAVGSGSDGILLVRGEDGRVRAFANVCRHRGHELLACGASAKRRGIICPYHSWSYKLTGELRNAPAFDGIGGPDANEFGLTELALVDWHGYLFVDPSGSAGDFAAHIAGLEDVVGPTGPRT